ncbi:MAG: segregation/condensation protein A [Candidatus Sumerlaeia bacterium]
MDLRVKLNVFDGPFDLLLHLIKVNEMDIYDIRIAEITHQYLEYLTAMRDLDLEVAGDYLVMAATLLNIKSRQILPATSDAAGGEEEQDDELDERMSAQELIRRLVEYRDIKDMAQDLRRREREFSHVFFRSQLAPIPLDDGERPPVQLREDLQRLFDAFVDVLRRMELRRDHVVRQEIYRVEDKIEMLTALLAENRTINAFDLFRRCLERREVIVTLIAILELCRQGRVLVRQDDHFRDILIEPGPGRPADEPLPSDGEPSPVAEKDGDPGLTAPQEQVRGDMSTPKADHA